MCGRARKRVYFYRVSEKLGSVGAKYAQTRAYFTQWGTEKFTFCISWSIFTFQINFPPITALIDLPDLIHRGRSMRKGNKSG